MENSKKKKSGKKENVKKQTKKKIMSSVSPQAQKEDVGWEKFKVLMEHFDPGRQEKELAVAVSQMSEERKERFLQFLDSAPDDMPPGIKSAIEFYKEHLKK